MKLIYRNEDRGYANHGWLEARHTFSFASWYNPERTNFGALRVFNDDRVSAKMGFGTHPHENMEIITIPLSGTVRHRDNMGNEGEIQPGEIQIMSAGTGVTHSEFNPNSELELKLFQIWIIPEKRNVTPRYQQLKINEFEAKNTLLQLVSPNPEDAGGWINQQAWIHYVDIEENQTISYQPKLAGNGIFVMTIEGRVEALDEILERRDALGITDVDNIELTAKLNSQLLIIEVPMTF
jgi:redox-sensitive bicupin YhaK (pirin superfamily)